jgi:hypothetical protein
MKNTKECASKQKLELKTTKEYFSKERLESKFGLMTDEQFSNIMESVSNDMQQLIDHNTIPKKSTFINILTTNCEYFLTQ